MREIGKKEEKLNKELNRGLAAILIGMISACIFACGAIIEHSVEHSNSTYEEKQAVVTEVVPLLTECLDYGYLVIMEVDNEKYYVTVNEKEYSSLKDKGAVNIKIRYFEEELKDISIEQCLE